MVGRSSVGEGFHSFVTSVLGLAHGAFDGGDDEFVVVVPVVVAVAPVEVPWLA